jgi:hypothetical protein
MSVQTAELFLLDDLDDAERTSALPERDLAALRAVANWTTSFVTKPHAELGRDGPVCPFVPGCLERGTFWLAPEHVEDADVAQVAELMDGYRRLFLDTEPVEGDNATYKVFVVVFTDLSAERAQSLFAGVQGQLALQAYADDGVIFGPFYEGNEGTALYNASFRPFQSPVPFLFVRNTVVTDWKFFVDEEEFFGLWAHRFGESGARALGEEIRRLPWRNAVS